MNRIIKIKDPNTLGFAIKSPKTLLYSNIVYEYLIAMIMHKKFESKVSVYLTEPEDNIRGADIMLSSDMFEDPSPIHYVDCKIYNMATDTLPITVSSLNDNTRLTDSYAVIIDGDCYWISKKKLKTLLTQDMFKRTAYSDERFLSGESFIRVAAGNLFYHLSDRSKDFYLKELEIANGISAEYNTIENINVIADMFRPLYLDFFKTDYNIKII